MPATAPPRKARLMGKGKPRFSPEVIAAWHACDWTTLHSMLNLSAYECSPLPLEINALGVSADTPPHPESKRLNDPSYPKALALQRALIACAGWPKGCKQVYEKNLQDAQEMAAYHRELAADLATGPRCENLVDRRQDLADARRRVVYYKRCRASFSRFLKYPPGPLTQID
jgi:hypothetical protein